MDNEDQENDLIQKLDYLGIDLENIPKFLYDFKPLEFNLSRLNNDKDHRVFRFVPINKIDILLTPCLREDSVREKYSKALPLGCYLANDQSQESLERYTVFLKMLREFSIPEVENVINLQKEMENEEPFKVRYNREHLWHIYYSEATDRYFMMVCTKEANFAEFFYLLKKKIEIANNPEKEEERIFIPINYVSYSEKFLNRNEIVDIENYLWLFTKEWPNVYEVYDKNDDMWIEILGKTHVYENLRSTYKIKFGTEEEAIKFYKVLKALFVMQSEMKERYTFTSGINSKNGLELYYENKKIDYENLTDFIKDEYDKILDEIKEQNEKCKKLEKDLEKSRSKTSKQEMTYLQKQKEIGAFLECKKTFSGRMRYFFKSNKIKKQIQKEIETENIKIEQPKNPDNTVDIEPINTYMEGRDLYTIEDLVVIYSIYQKSKKKLQNITQDLKAMNLKLENFKRKVKNAETYIKEIDEHKKSFFDFWKFTKKDEILALEEGEVDEKPSENQISKVFDLEMDLENLGVKMDKAQRIKLSKEETDSSFIVLDNNLADVINSLRKGNMDEAKIKACFKILKEDFNQNRLLVDNENFDIFGSLLEDSRKTKYIGSRSHRENEKSKYRILNVNRNIDEFDFTEKLQSTINYLEGAIPKIQSTCDMSLYKLVKIVDKIDTNAFWTMNLDIENEFEIFDDEGEGALNLIKINLKEGMPLLFYTNIMLYDNQNLTLPEGMDLSKQVLIDTSKFDFTLVNQTKFRTNDYFRESENLIRPKSKDIFVYEYDVERQKIIKFYKNSFNFQHFSV